MREGFAIERVTSPLVGEVDASLDLSGEASGERLSGLSSCACKFFAGVACFCVEPDEELSGESDAHDLFEFAGFVQPAVEVGELRHISANDLGDGEEDGSDMGSSAAHRPLSLAFAAIVGDGREARQLGKSEQSLHR